MRGWWWKITKKKETNARMPGDHLPTWKVSFRTFLYSNSSICILDGVARRFMRRSILKDVQDRDRWGREYLPGSNAIFSVKNSFFFPSSPATQDRMNSSLLWESWMLYSNPEHLVLITTISNFYYFFISLPAPLSCNLIISRCNTLLAILYLVYPQPGMGPGA